MGNDMIHSVTCYGFSMLVQLDSRGGALYFSPALQIYYTIQTMTDFMKQSEDNIVTLSYYIQYFYFHVVFIFNLKR